MTAKDLSAAYATWTQPGTQFTVSYSVPLFQEIDFVINEGYRRIPHGGIEVGGVLFGRVDGSTVCLDAFRNIECEHASGPSFTLSERDVALLRQQLSSAASDPELQGLQVAGWFIAHTRSELRMNEREAALFDELFPEPGKITVLIKPERFQPTRFGFVIREPDGRVNLDASQNAVILPLSGRADREPGSGSIPSIPAPSSERSASNPALFSQGERSRENLLSNPIQASPKAVPESSIDSEGERDAATERIQPPSEAPRGERTRTISNRLSMALSRQPVLPETAPEEFPPYSDGGSDAPAEALVRATTLPPLGEFRRTRQLEIHTSALDPGDLRYQNRTDKQAGKRSSRRLLSALLVAVVLGCALGYSAYQRLSPSAIPLTIEPRPSTLLVSWPVEETRDAGFAVLKIDDGNPMPLTPEQRSAGEAEISVAGDNLKIELIVPHRIGDARGIVRYVRASKPPFPENP
jgi:hypothetical protein